MDNNNKQIDAFNKSESILIKCPYCDNMIQTQLEYECGVNSWIICFFLCIFTQCFCFLPLCFKKCKDIIHTCPKCRKEVGVKEFEC